MKIGWRFLSGVALIGLLLSGVATAQENQRLPIPDGAYYYVPASTVFGPEAAWINPAGIGNYRASSFQLMADYFDKDFAKTWGAVMTWQDLALSYRTVHRAGESDFKDYLLATGIPIGEDLSVGASYQYFRGPSIFDKRHMWTAGLLKQGGSPWSFAVVLSNLNRIPISGQSSAIEQRYSIGYQPTGDKLTFAVDMLLATKMKFKNATFVYHAEYTPLPGLFINGYIDSHREYQVGVRANLLKYFVGNESSFSRQGNGRGTTFYAGSTSLRQPTVLKEPPKRLQASISGGLSENPPQPILGRKQLAYPTLLLALYRAANDPYIKDVVVSLDGPSLGFARAQELRDAFGTIRAAGKRVVCHLANAGNLSYYAASAANAIYISPVSQLNLVGLRAEMTFYAGTMEKVGIKADMVKIGPYKTAAESFMRSSSSDENKQQLNRLLDDLYRQFTEGLAEGRGISNDSVKTLIDHGPYTSVEALENRLIDGLYYTDQVDSSLGFARSISLSGYLRDTVMNRAWVSKPVLALVVAEGDITGNGGNQIPFGQDGGITPGKMARAFSQATTDRRVKGIVMRIDSPGGEALASDDIFRSAVNAARRMPLVVSMSNSAASGGYYAAMPGERLYASPGTVTGSIGIFGGKPDFSGFYQKLSLGKELYTRGHFAGMMTTTRPFTDEERQKYLDQLSAFYGHFVDLVAANRNLTHDSVDALGQGQVWTGREALSNGLVDEIGGLKQALDGTATEVGINDYRVVIYPVVRPLFLLPARPLLNGLVSIFGGHNRGNDQSLADALGGVPKEGLYTRIPYDLVIQ